jgi:hypothetical protein
MKFRKFLIAALATSMTFAGSIAHAGNDTSWIPTDKNWSEPTVHSIAFMDKLTLPQEHSVLSVWSNPNAYVCKSTSDSSCVSGNEFEYTSVLKVCSSPTDIDCVSQVNSIDSNGVSTPADFSRYTVANHLNAFPADPKLGIPEGSMPSIWSIPSAPHTSGSDYAVFAGLHGFVDRNGQETSGGSVMQISLIPVVLKDFGKGHQSISTGWSQSIPGIYYDYCSNSAEKNKPTYLDCSHSNGSSCLFSTAEQGMCYAEVPFGKAQKFNVQLRLSKEPTGWMHGRMVDPLISITHGSKGEVSLSVTAGATNVPMVYQTGTWASLPAKLQDLWVKCNSSLEECSSYWEARTNSATSDYIQLSKTLDGNAGLNMIEYVKAFGKLPLEILANIAPLIGDKSQAQSTTWSVRTLTNAEMNGSNRCFTSTPGLKGIVSTNSTAYSAGPPEFKDGSLNYQVASPHFNPDGTTPFKGNYNLVMRSDVARCIYGFTSAPIQASISVISADGNSDIATSVTGEKDGWISLSANNFQFSSPIIRVKLTQPKVLTESKTTITCFRGKNIKTVSSIKPTCPIGYKKR